LWGNRAVEKAMHLLPALTHVRAEENRGKREETRCQFGGRGEARDERAHGHLVLLFVSGGSPKGRALKKEVVGGFLGAGVRTGRNVKNGIAGAGQGKEKKERGIVVHGFVS